MYLMNFDDAELVARFSVVNDAVMGGVSASRVFHEPGALVFEGEVSLENNGGFASFRGPVSLPTLTEALVVHLRGDGKRYKLTLKLQDSNAAVQYQAPWQSSGEAQVLRFTPGDFRASFRGKRMDAPALDFSRVRVLGFLISEQQAGPFRLEVQRVEAQ